jgi:restriction endonuclease Mrr
MWPLILALRSHEEARVDEIDAAVRSQCGAAAQGLERPRGTGKRTEFAYRCAWARTRLRDRGYIKRVGHARWSLTSQGREATRAEVEGSMDPPT